MRYFGLFLVTLMALCACGEKPSTMDDFNTRDVTLPDGAVIHMETMMDQTDMLRGMMFRKSLAADRGMLFIHRKPGTFTYWMYQTLIPLDIIWLDSSRQVVEIVADAPPCQTEASKCPRYGGHELAQYVIQIGAGQAKKHGLKAGDSIRF